MEISGGHLWDIFGIYEGYLGDIFLYLGHIWGISGVKIMIKVIHDMYEHSSFMIKPLYF